MNSSSYVLCIFVAVCFTAVSADLTCGGRSEVSSIQCNGKEMTKGGLCELKRGQNASLVLAFVPGMSSKNVTAVCHGVIGGIPIPFNSINHQGCEGLTPSCPLVPKRPETFKTTIPVKQEYPKLKLIIKWELQDIASGDDVVCIVIPAQLV
ncbi:Phosphatidylglycerol/phosphatidylinositol transfer protein [Mactra antiquata]